MQVVNILQACNLQSVRLFYFTDLQTCFTLRLAWYKADSIRRFDSKTNRTTDSIRDSIRMKKTIHRSLVVLAINVLLMSLGGSNLNLDDQAYELL